MASIKMFEKGTDGLVNFAIVLAIGLTVLSTLGNTTGLSVTANTTIQSIITGLAGFADWIALIVLLIVVAYLRKRQSA